MEDSHCIGGAHCLFLGFFEYIFFAEPFTHMPQAGSKHISWEEATAYGAASIHQSPPSGPG